MHAKVCFPERRLATVLLLCFALSGTGAVAGAQPASTPARAQSSAALFARAHRLLDRSQYRAARPVLERALADAPTEPERETILLALALADWGVGDYQAAFDRHREALRLARSTGNFKDECTALNGLGLNAYSLGRYDEALDFYHQALAADAREPSAKFEGLVYANIGLVQRYKGELDAALASFQRSLALRQQAGDAAGVAQTLNHLGIVSRARGELPHAIEYYTRSLAERRRLHDRQGEAQTLNNLGNVYLDLDERDRALGAYGESLQIAQAIGYTFQVALASANVADVLVVLGRDAKAIGRYTTALATYRRLGRRSQIADVTRKLGALQTAAGHPLTARRLLEESLRVAREIDEPDSEALALDELGRLEEKAGHTDAARARYSDGVAITDASPMPDVAYFLLTDRGDLARRAGRLDAAIADLRAAAAIVTDMRARLTTDLGKIGYLDRHADVFTSRAEALLSAARSEDALEAVESGRARAMADLLGSRSAGLKPADREALQSLSRAANASQDDTSASGPTLDRAFDALRSRDGELASIIAVESPHIDEIRATASRLQATILEYLAADNEIAAWVVSPDGTTHVARTPTRSRRLQADVRTLSRALASPEAATVGPTAGAQNQPSSTAVLRRLERQLVAPVERWLPTSPDVPVIVIAGGWLAQVPFAALPDARGTPLLARHTLAYAPGVSALRYTVRRPRPGGEASALVIADPAAPRDSGLAALPAARAEAAAVSASLPHRVRLLTGAAATEAAVKADAGSFDILHFATHGLVWPDRPLASSLVLAESKDEDGYLRVSEVFGLDLHARLIVLSGCATGAGRITGDGVLGFARAFMYAGAPDIVVSQWDVTDRGAAALMKDFYAGIAAGLSPARALRDAELRARARDANPRTWAAFIMVGQP